MASDFAKNASIGQTSRVEKPLPATSENAKHRQILDGALDVFRARGYDGASMETIARQAGVSKGTLYVYFPNKEELFKELILQECKNQPETYLEVSGPAGDIDLDLKRICVAYLEKMVKPARISTLRMVIGAVEKFPEFGALLYDEGAQIGAQRMAGYLEQKIESGEIRRCDTRQAAEQLLSLCTSSTLKRVLLKQGKPPSREELRAQVEAGIDVFLSAYGTKQE